MKVPRDEGSGKILLGDNTDGGASCCGRSDSTVLKSEFQLDPLVYMTHNANETAMS